MFYNLKITIRNLRNNRLYSVINIAGLAVSLTAVIFIMLWVWDELNYDKIGKRSDNTFLLEMIVANNENNQYWTQTSIPMLQAAKEHIPDVEEGCAVNIKYNMAYIAHEGKVFSGDAFCKVDTSFFRVFNVPFIEGTTRDALAPGSIVLTRSLAKKIFGDEPAAGKHLTGKDETGSETKDYFVSAVIADFPEHSFLHFDAFVPFEQEEIRKFITMWGYQNFLLLRPSADSKAVAQQLTKIYDKEKKAIQSFQLQSFNDIHLYDPSGKETGMVSVRLFSWIAGLILLIACVNYVNLVTARASKRNKEIGIKRMDKEMVCSVNIGANAQMQEHYAGFKSDLEQLPSIAGVTAASTNVLNAHIYAYTISFQWEGMDKNNPIRALDMGIDDSFFETMNIPVIKGADFSHTLADANRFYLNETAVKQMGIADPIGLNVSLFGHAGQIAGIVRDFHFRTLNYRIDPVIMTVNDHDDFRMIYIRFHKGNTVESLASVEKIWKKYSGDIPFSYDFLDDTLHHLYKPEQQKSRLFGTFSFIAIFISCLGLFGLVTYTAETKTKEIGIRKVLGASVSSIVNMLSKEFLILVGIALLFAFPLAYYWIDRMLQDYAYHIRIGWWMFALAGLITMVLTLITVGWQAVKAATENPVKAIKAE